MTEATNQVDSINVQDIAAAVRVIDVATSRGAWQGAELSSVGLLRDKFAGFVEAANAQIEAARAEQADTDAEQPQPDVNESDED